MASKQKRSFSRFILDVLTLIPNVLSLVRHATAVIKLEAQLAIKNVISLIVFAVIAAILLISIWFGLLAILFVYLISIHWTYLSALILLIIINLLGLLLTLFFMSKTKNKLFHHRHACRRHCTCCDEE